MTPCTVRWIPFLIPFSAVFLLQSPRESGVVMLPAAQAQPAKPSTTYRLQKVRVIRGKYLRELDKNFKDSEEFFPSNPGTIQFTLERPTYKLSGAFTISVPTTLKEGEKFTTQFLAVATWDLKNAGGSIQIQSHGPYTDKSEQLRSDFKPLPAGRHTLTLDHRPQPVFKVDGLIYGGVKDGINYRTFEYTARYNTGNQFDSVAISALFTFSNDPKLTGSAVTTPASPVTPSSDHCPATFDGVWEDWGAHVGARRGHPPTGTGGTWGAWTFKESGANVTGSIPNMAGKYGAATITGTITGKTLRGAWRSSRASGALTLNRSADNCTVTGTYTVDVPPGEPPGHIGPGSGTTGPGGPHDPTGAAGAGGHGKPWETASGKNCFEQWIALATRLLNQVDGGSGFNARKPWSFNKYGLLEGKGISSAYAPDDFAAHGNNRYWWMWDYYNTDALGRFIHGPPQLNQAGVPPLRDYVRRCDPSSATPSLPADGMILIAPDLIVARGTQVLVPVRLLRAKDVLNMDFELSYLPEIASARTNVERGSLIAHISEFKLNRPGLFKFNFAQLSPIKGDGTVAGFRFDAIGPGGSRTPLTLAVHRVDGTNASKLPITTIHGSITIYDPNNRNDPNHPLNPNPPGGATASQPQPTCSGTGRQTVVDAQCCLKMWVGLTAESLHMDVDNSGKVDSADAVRILRNVAAGL